MQNVRTADERATLVFNLKNARIAAEKANPDMFAENNSGPCFDAQIDVIENDLTSTQVADKYGDMSSNTFNQDVFDHASAASDYLLGNLDAYDICDVPSDAEPDPDMVNEGENRFAGQDDTLED